MQEKNKIRKSKQYFAPIFGIALMATLGGCSTIGKMGAKPVSAPIVEIESFRDAVPASPDNSVAWWQNFSDETLNQLVKDAQSENIALLIAEARLKEARAQGRATIAGFAPRIDVSSNISTSKITKGGDLINANTGAIENSQSLATTNVAASWELPLFGRLSSSLKGAKANEENAKLGIEAAKIALIGDIAAAYIDLRSAQTRLQYLEEDYARAKTLNAVAQDRLRVGLISKADASFAQTSLAAIEAQIPDAKLFVRAGLNRIAILRGVAPGSLDAQLAPIRNFEFKKNVPQITSIPAEFVRRRLDVRQAEQQAILQGAAVGIAKADILPSVSISGALTLLSAVSGAPIAGDITRTNISPNIGLTLFDFGQKMAAIKQADSRFTQSLLNYKAVTLGAIAEGQQALASYDFARDRLIGAQNGEEAALIRYNAAVKSFSVGLIAMKDRVEAERDYNQARNARLSAQAQYSDAAIAIYRVFAGSPQII